MDQKEADDINRRLYELFCKADGQFTDNRPSTDRAMIEVGVGNLPSAYELLKDEKGKTYKTNLEWIIDVFQESFKNTHEWKIVKPMSRMQLLLWREYFEIARDWASKGGKNERWKRYLEIYKVSRDMQDVYLARKAMKSIRHHFHGDLLLDLIEMAKITENYDDLEKAKHYFFKRWRTIDFDKKVESLTELYHLTSISEFLEKAMSVVEESDIYYHGTADMHSLLMKIDESDREIINQRLSDFQKRLDAIAKKHEEEQKLTFEGRCDLAYKSGDIAHLEIAIGMITAEQDKKARIKMIAHMYHILRCMNLDNQDD